VQRREAQSVGDLQSAPAGEEFRVGAGGADGEDSGAGSFACTRAGGGVFDDHAIGGRELQGLRRPFQIGLGMRLAVLNVAGGDEVMGEVPDTSGAEADFGPDCGRPEVTTTRWEEGHGGEEFAGAGESDDVGIVFDFRREASRGLPRDALRGFSWGRRSLIEARLVRPWAKAVT